MPSIAFHNEKWITQASLTISVDDLGFRQGVTVVERLRTYGGRLFQPRWHAQRFLKTCSALHLSGIPDEAGCIYIAEELLVRNGPFVHGRGDVGMAWFATPGAGGDSPPTFAMHLQSLPTDRIAKFLSKGQPLVLTTVCQPTESSWSRQWKVRCRMHYYLADEQAREIDEDASGVLVDADGSVTETSISNLAIVRNGEVVSPPCEQVLAGITQRFVESIAEELGIRWRHARLMPEDLTAADVVLLMGTDGGLWWCNRFGGTPFSSGGPLYRSLRTQFDQRVLGTCR